MRDDLQDVTTCRMHLAAQLCSDRPALEAAAEECMAAHNPLPYEMVEGVLLSPDLVPPAILWVGKSCTSVTQASTACKSSLSPGSTAAQSWASGGRPTGEQLCFAKDRLEANHRGLVQLAV